MIPFGPWQPDVAGINTKVCREARNVFPDPIGFTPVRSPKSITSALSGACIGSAVALRADGTITGIAGDRTKLYRLASATWNDVTRVTGGAYATASGDRWQFTQWGDTIIATNYTDVPQKLDLVSGTNFLALGGSPPRARYLDVVRDQVLLGALFGNQMRVHWSGINNSEFWTPGTNSCDYQDATSGGPVRGVLGGAQGYVLQQARVTRMTFTPGSTTVYQFDEVQGGKGLHAPYSLVKIGNVAYYLSTDGFYFFDLASGGSKPIGSNKWRRYFLDDMRSGTHIRVIGAADPLNPIILWAYVSRDNGGLAPDRMVVYNWQLDEATLIDTPVEALSSWLTAGVTLDTMNSFGTLDTLPYSLDSPFWKGGNAIVGIFGNDHKLSHLLGTPMAATFETSDGQGDGRVFVTATEPLVDTTAATVSVVARERDGDSASGEVAFGVQEAMEDTGEVPAHASGNIVRARIVIPSGSNWSLMKGIKTTARRRGKR